MKIALAVEGTRGDVFPMLDLGCAFRDAGHEVTLCGPANFEQPTRERALEFREVGRDTRALLEEIAHAVPSRGLAGLRAQSDYYRDTVARQFELLPRAARGADLILGAGAQIAGPSVAELLGVPYRYLVYCPGLFPSPDHTPVFLPIQGLPRWANRVAWWFILHVIDPTLRAPINHGRAQLGLAPIRNATLHAMTPRPMLAADPVLAPIPRECAVDVLPMNCLHAHEPAPLPAKLEAFIAQGPAPVYLGFGSMPDADATGTTRMLLGVVERLGMRAILSAGWAGLGEGPLPENVMSIGAVSHAALFPRMAMVVHHGGAGTTTSAARAGVPQIVIPHLLDQYWWGKRVAELGLAPPPLPRVSLTAEALEESIRSVADNEMLSQRAREIGRRITPAERPDEIAARILRDLA